MATEKVSITFNADKMAAFADRWESVCDFLTKGTIKKIMSDCGVDVDTESGMDELFELVDGEGDGIEISILLNPSRKAWSLLEALESCPVTPSQ